MPVSLCPCSHLDRGRGTRAAARPPRVGQHRVTAGVPAAPAVSVVGVDRNLLECSVRDLSLGPPNLFPFSLSSPSLPPLPLASALQVRSVLGAMKAPRRPYHGRL